MTWKSTYQNKQKASVTLCFFKW